MAVEPRPLIVQGTTSSQMRETNPAVVGCMPLTVATRQPLLATLPTPLSPSIAAAMIGLKFQGAGSEYNVPAPLEDREVWQWRVTLTWLDRGAAAPTAP